MGVCRDVSLCAEEFLALVDYVYEGPLEPEPWSSFAEQLRATLAARNVAITLHHSEGVVFDTYVMAKAPGDDTDWDDVERTYRQRYMRDDPRRLELVQPGEVVTIDARKESQGVGRFLAAHDIGSCLRTSFAEPGGMRCWIDVMRRRTPHVPFDQAEVALIERLLPHLARSLRLYAGQKRQELEKKLYEETVEHFLLGSVVLDGERRVVHTNRVADTLIAQHSGIHLSRGRLRLAEPGAQRALDAALGRALAASGDDAAEQRGDLIRVERHDAQPLGLLVRPINQARFYRGSHAPSIVVYLADPNSRLEALQPARASSQALVAGLFGLTRQEARLALLLADGCTLAAAAESIGVAETAARSYSKRIYAKMGIRGQSDIVRMVHRSFALLR